MERETITMPHIALSIYEHRFFVWRIWLWKAHSLFWMPQGMDKHTCAEIELKLFRGSRHEGWMIYKVLSVPQQMPNNQPNISTLLLVVPLKMRVTSGPLVQRNLESFNSLVSSIDIVNRYFWFKLSTHKSVQRAAASKTEVHQRVD